MADIRHKNCKNRRKTSPNRRNFALYQEIGVGNRTAVSKFTPEIHKIPFLRMRSANVAENGRK